MMPLALVLSVALNVGLVFALVRLRRRRHFGATLTVEPFVRPFSVRPPLHVVRDRR